MSIEIGSLVVRGSFGRGQTDSDGVVKDTQLRDQLEALRRDLRDELARAADDIERRLRET